MNQKIKTNIICALFFVCCLFVQYSFCNKHVNEVLVDGLIFKDKQVILRVNFSNNSNDIVLIPKQYLQLSFFENSDEVSSTNNHTFISDVVYPAVDIAEGHEEEYHNNCHKAKSIKNYLVLDKEKAFIEYDLTKLGYSYLINSDKELSGRLYASEELEDYCSKIWTGEIRFDIDIRESK